jgi:hypothetical protein
MRKFIWALALFLLSCSQQDISKTQEEKVFILIDGEEIEMVADEYGNQYLKQKGFYIPYPFESEEVVDSLSFLEAKTIQHVKRRF